MEIALQYRSLCELVPWERNYRVGNVDAICNSIRLFGFNGALRVWGNVVIAGNHAYAALMKLQGESKVPPVGVRVDNDEWSVPCLDVSAHLTYEQAEAFAIADNRTQELGSNDIVKLVALLESMDARLSDVAGYSDLDITRLLDMAPKEVVNDDVAPPIDDSTFDRFNVQVGDVWKCGNHILSCNDATKADAYLDWKDCDLLMTDPPYGVSYVGKTKRALPIRNDDASLRVPMAILKESLGRIRPGGSVYVFAPSGPNIIEFLNLLISKNILRQMLIWVKNTFVLGRSNYHYQSESILYGWVPGKKATWASDRSQSNVLMYDKPARSADHPTMKPVEMLQYLICNSSLRGDIVLDPCLGSGSTMVACERTGRRCFGIEVDPAYMAVALNRALLIGVTPERM